MTTLSAVEHIWVVEPTLGERQEAAEYAATTVPWTYNRMGKRRDSAGVRECAMNIAKGVVAQECLRRRLTSIGIRAPRQIKSHRTEDLYDFQIECSNTTLNIDLKTWVYYRDFRVAGRDPLTLDMIVDNRSNSGPNWGQFFPMLVPDDQIGKKDAYCFGFADTFDMRRDLNTDRDAYMLAAFPHGDAAVEALMSGQTCALREQRGTGLFLDIAYNARASADAIELIVVGEWDGGVKREAVRLTAGADLREIGPFGAIGSLQLSKSHFDALAGEVVVSVGKDNLNRSAGVSFAIGRNDFCNLMLPHTYRLYFLGWISNADYSKACRTYPSWIWPNNASRFENQPWTSFDYRDKTAISKAGYDDCLRGTPQRLHAGWLKSTWRTGGACCFVYPNLGQRGGVRRTNLYTLPQDLRIMDETGAMGAANATR